MRKRRNKPLEFEIDKLINSIENSLTGEIFDTAIARLTMKDAKFIIKKNWIFDWHKEVEESENEVYKLTTINNPTIIQGLISITDKKDHVFMNLIESSAFNKGSYKLYRGVAGNLVAFACKLSFEKHYDGVVSFIAKTALIKHYQETLNAKLFGRNRMFIDTADALTLVNQYFKDFHYDKF